jgi:glycosyltransferase involved in cell wall biosynthesis
VKLVFLIDNMNFSGGRKLFFEYALFLARQGHEVQTFCREMRGELAAFLPCEAQPNFTAKTIPPCDLIVATTHKEVADAAGSKIAPVVHFCQAYEITDLEQRIHGTVIPPRFQGRGLLNRIRLFRKKLSWKRKIHHYDRIYRLPTHLVTISKHIQSELKKRYRRPVKLCVNGIHQEFFHPAENWQPPTISTERPLRIVNIGPQEVSFKGINTTLKAMEILKSKSIPVHFTRVTPKANEADRSATCIDELKESMTQEELGNLLRSSDVYISNSTEGEGFGLPAMEALASGTVAVLSNISSYRNFDESRNFCFFVPENDVWATVNAIESILAVNPAELAKMRSRAIKIASLYSHDRACQRFETILRQFISGTGEDLADTQTS